MYLSLASHKTSEYQGWVKMNMPCCGQVVDTVRRINDNYELLVEFSPPTSYYSMGFDNKVEELYLPISYCPFCGVPLDAAQQIYEYNLDEMPTM